MNEQNKEITSNNLIRIKDEKVVETLNVMYEKMKNTYQSKNKFLMTLLNLECKFYKNKKKIIGQYKMKNKHYLTLYMNTLNEWIIL